MGTSSCFPCCPRAHCHCRFWLFERTHAGLRTRLIGWLLLMTCLPPCKRSLRSTTSISRKHVTLALGYPVLGSSSLAPEHSPQPMLPVSPRVALTLVVIRVLRRLVVDGSGTPTGRSCLAQRWLPWNATWIVGRSALLYRSVIVHCRQQHSPPPCSDPIGALESNNVSLGYNRYQVPHSPTPCWPQLRAMIFCVLCVCSAGQQHG
jgi:hypothetical protein